MNAIVRHARHVVVVAALTVGVAWTARAEVTSEAERARRANVVARVGERTITVGELEDRMNELPRFQLAEFGATPPERKKNFLERVILRDVLLELGGQKREAARSPSLANQVKRVRATATLRAIQSKVPQPAQIDSVEIKDYFEKHRAQYDAPERVAVWRILVATKQEAETVITEAKKDLTVAAFTTLARDKSLDKATHLRAGNLGFLADDGTSNEAGVRVEPSLVRAAKTVKDGELVPTPVEEGQHGFAVVWRRGTVAPVKRTLAEVDEQIRAIVHRRKVEDATNQLIDELKKTKLGQVDTELLRTTDLPSYL